MSDNSEEDEERREDSSDEPMEDESVVFDSDRDNKTTGHAKHQAKISQRTPRKPRRAGPPPKETFINQTAFDVYFAHATGKLYKSDNLISSLIEPLTQGEFDSIKARMEAKSEDPSLRRLASSHFAFFPHYWLELHAGYNLLFHGYGSKRSVLTEFAKEFCASNGHVLVINGYKKGGGFKTILAGLNQIPGYSDSTVASAGWEDQIARAYEFFRNTRHPRLYIIVHNIESQGLRDNKSRSLLSTLALHPRIHIVASADHIDTAALWSSGEISARKHPTTAAGADIPVSRGYSWLFHDLTTFQPYVEEMKSRDITSLPSQGQPLPGASMTHQALTEPAMVHVLASVTEKAKRLFQLLATRQIAAIEEGGERQVVGVSGLEMYGMQYDLLFNEARKGFIATSDVALRALLGEFMDHGMIKIGGQPETLWIPATKEIIRRVLQNIEAQI